MDWGEFVMFHDGHFKRQEYEYNLVRIGWQVNRWVGGVLVAVNSKKGHRPNLKKICPLPGERSIPKGPDMSKEEMMKIANKVKGIKFRPMKEGEKVRL